MTSSYKRISQLFPMSENLTVGILSTIPSKKSKPIKITNFGGFRNLAEALISDEKLKSKNPLLLKRLDNTDFVKSIEKDRPILLVEQYHNFLKTLNSTKSNWTPKNIEKFNKISKQLLENYVDSSEEEQIRKELAKEFEVTARILLQKMNISHEVYGDETFKAVGKVILNCDLTRCRCGKAVEDGKLIRVPLSFNHFVLRRVNY